MYGQVGKGGVGKVTTDFFQSKKPWSIYKDMILSYYLKPYLPKVCSLGKPVVLVDCFAGPGRFEDGSDGSPLIIAKAIRQANKEKSASAIFIEAKKKYYCRLQDSVKDYKEICRTVNGSFEESAREIARIARNKTIFVYIDPYGIKPLRFDTLSGIYRNIAYGSSVEVLLNFNASSLVRQGRAALRYAQQDDAEEELDRTMVPDDIDAIAGGDYWRKIVTSDTTFSQMEEEIVSAYMKLMRQYFAEVCGYPIKEKYEHTVPKYRLLFGSRNDDAYILMNDAISNARDKFLGRQCVEGRLFDMRADDEIHDPNRLRKIIMESLTTFVTRKKLIVRAMHQAFAEYKESEYKSMIGCLLKEGCLQAKSGKTRINDREILLPRESLNEKG
jgi:three-Cys-motif partner protein